MLHLGGPAVGQRLLKIEGFDLSLCGIAIFDKHVHWISAIVLSVIDLELTGQY